MGYLRYCLGYIEAVGQLMVTNGYERTKISGVKASQYLTDTALCQAPSGGVPSGAALIQAFVNWSDKHPEHWADHTLIGVLLALRSTWPCSN
jgi:hypothetical protein